jgi:ATP adenylyltransferase
VDVIWAPWRMEFLVSERPPGCVLCGYVDVAPAASALVLAQRPLAYVVLNKYPYTSGHIMVVPKRHVSMPTELSQAESTALWSLVQASIAPLRSATGCEGINLGMNLGRVAGAGIHEHIHVHLVPRWEGDNNFMPVLGTTRVMPEYLEQSWNRLASAFAEVADEVNL